MEQKFSFVVKNRLKNTRARTGVITTAHGIINTPAFIPVGTQATLKSLTPEQLDATGAQAVLANAYHLYLRPGNETVAKAGGLHKFMNWNKPIFTDSGGFQVMSLGVGFKKIIDMSGSDSMMETKKDKLAWIDNDGVSFKSHIDGSSHRLNPEKSIEIQHDLGADIIFAFDELTTLHHPRSYQEESLANRTHPWAVRSLTRHKELLASTSTNYHRALFGVIQGANFQDLRIQSARFMADQDFDGFGLGGAYTKNDIGTIVGWMVDELPEAKPRHMLGISEPDDIFDCIENGADTFDCVSPARVARNGALYTAIGRINITNQKYKQDFSPIELNCDCYTCKNYSKAYLNHLFKAKEMLGGTLATIHNEQFIVRLVDGIRYSIDNSNFYEYRQEFIESYYNHKPGVFFK